MRKDIYNYNQQYSENKQDAQGTIENKNVFQNMLFNQVKSDEEYAKYIQHID